MTHSCASILFNDCVFAGRVVWKWATSGRRAAISLPHRIHSFKSGFVPCKKKKRVKFKNPHSQFWGKNFLCKTYRGNLITAVSHARGNSDTAGDESSESKGSLRVKNF